MWNDNLGLYPFLSWTFLQHSPRISKAVLRNGCIILNLHLLSSWLSQEKKKTLLFYSVLHSNIPNTANTMMLGKYRIWEKYSYAETGCTFPETTWGLSSYSPMTAAKGRVTLGSHFLKVFLSNSYKQSFILFWNQVKKIKKNHCLLKGKRPFRDDVYSHKDRLHTSEV